MANYLGSFEYTFRVRVSRQLDLAERKLWDRVRPTLVAFSIGTLSAFTLWALDSQRATLQLSEDLELLIPIVWLILFLFAICGIGYFILGLLVGDWPCLKAILQIRRFRRFLKTFEIL